MHHTQRTAQREGGGAVSTAGCLIVVFRRAYHRVVPARQPGIPQPEDRVYRSQALCTLTLLHHCS